MTEFYKCDKCGWIHCFVAYEEVAQDENLESYLKCFICKSSTDNFIKIDATDVPRSSTIQAFTKCV